MKNLVREVPARLEINTDIFKKDDLFKVVHKKTGDSRIYIVDVVTAEHLRLITLRGLAIVIKVDQMDCFDFVKMKIVEDNPKEITKEECEKTTQEYIKYMKEMVYYL